MEHFRVSICTATSPHCRKQALGQRGVPAPADPAEVGLARSRQGRLRFCPTSRSGCWHWIGTKEDKGYGSIRSSEEQSLVSLFTEGRT